MVLAAGVRWAGVLLVICPMLRSTSAYAPVAPDKPSEVGPCSCPDPLYGDAVCYEPVCPLGYYKCCATCGDAPCFSEEDLMISWRGIPECIKCTPGDFCDGCDDFKKCPPSVRPGREGARVTKPGAIAISNCEVCAVGTEAWFDGQQCASQYSKATDECGGKPCCNVEFVARCQRNCESPDVFRRKQLTECEKMKCAMFCAKQWSDDCAMTLGKHCEYVTTPPLQSGYVDETVIMIVGCDVDCNGASRQQSVFAGVLVVGIVIACLSHL